jgi:hypothetical protein
MGKIIPEWDLNDIGPFCYEHFMEKLKKPFTEDTMIDILIKQQSWFDILQAILALRKTGTEKSIKYLKTIVLEYNNTKKMDIQGAGVLTIAKLADGMENEFFGKLLLNENYKNKWYAMAAIFYKINDKALPYVLEYGINKIKKSKNMPQPGGLVLTYLAKYAQGNEQCSMKDEQCSMRDEQCKRIFTGINNDFEEMDKETKEYLKNEYPKIFGIK